MTDRKLIELLERKNVPRAPEALADLRRVMVQDFVLCTEWREDRESRARGNILAPTMYQLSGQQDRDVLFLGHVIDVGPGVTINGQHESMCVAKGEVFLANLSNLSYRFHERGRRVYQIRNGVIAAVIGKDFHVKPVQDQILVRANEERAVRHSSGGPIWVPTGAFDTDDSREVRRTSSAIVAEYGEVVDQGPGCWREGQWHAPTCQKGDLILYDASWGTLPITIKGEAFTLVPSRQMCLIADSV